MSEKNIMNLTPYHAKFFALDITKKCFADNIEKIIPVLSDAKVDLNPHQIEAALFAFKSPFSKGAILADEVGLGKTIEAGLVISQNWAERKRKILIIVPASLRKQWSTELVEKFYLPSVIMESKSFNQAIKDGHFNPFESADIVITSYNFAKQKVDYIKHINWDLVVIDEAHRLRNVYKNNNKMAKAIKEAVSPFKKILLTATPLQNSLLELFGLVGFIDENIFGDINAFRSLYVRNGDNINNDYIDLQARLKPICIRTLRRQVIEYINYTKRIAFTQEFTPNPDEQSLYDVVSDYLSGQSLYALPNSQRHLITLIMRKLLASSSFAITETLKSLISRLEKIEQRVNEANSSENNIDLNDILDEDVSEIYIDESESEESEIEDNSNLPLTKEQWRAFQKEIKDLRKYLQIAEGIQVNAKGDALLIALQTGFAKMKELGAAQKAVIFTESRRTQEYVNGLLTHYGYNVVQFNGSNNDAKSNSIYKQWVETHKGTSVVTGSQTADKRAALIESFKEQGDILLATEAAAEGINLQFCSLVVNYDLPWNPQRIEQRIGRCHRYGQKYDVVVINFINQKNEADKRVYQLLAEKFKLFDGVFGASDEVLGNIESGVDFEKRINQIYQKCRTPQDISTAFELLQQELEASIDDRMKVTRQKLLENFDEEVSEKLRIRKSKSEMILNKFEKEFWAATKYALQNFAEFDDDKYVFGLKHKPFDIQDIEKGNYKLGKPVDESYITYRMSHPLADYVLSSCKDLNTPTMELTFDLSNNVSKITVLENLKGQTGEMALYNITILGAEQENYLVFVGITDSGEILDSEICERFFSLNAVVGKAITIQHGDKMKASFYKQKAAVLHKIDERNANFFNEEMQKLDSWADDLKNSLEMQLKQLDVEIKTLKVESLKTVVLVDKLIIETQRKDKEKRRNQLRRNLFEEQDAVDRQKDVLLEQVAERLKQTVNEEMVFSVKWIIN
jgi:superfamily II DNA/RNA helicase